jgi:hypothetical protein
MFRSMIHACVATLAMWSGAVWAQQWDDAARADDVRTHFDHGWNNDHHFGRGDAIDRTLNRGADPLRSNFGVTTGGSNLYWNDGVQNYGSPNYLNQYFGTGYYGDSFFPGQWYYQNRRYISPYGGLYRYPSDRFYTR